MTGVQTGDGRKSGAGAGARRRVVVALHGRRAPSGAIALGRLMASALRASLHGLFVSPHPISAMEVPKLLHTTPGALEGLVLDVEVGEPAERLVAAVNARPTALAIVAVSPDEDGELGVGDLASRVLAGAEAGVLVTPEREAPPRLGRVLVPLDGTPSTASALGPAGELALATGAVLDIVMIGGPKAAAAREPGAMGPPQYIDQPQHEWPAFSDEFLQRFVTALGHCPCGVPTRLFLGAGDPATEILRYARELESDLVVLVWHGHLEDHHGEVFRTVLRASACPVLVLRR